MLSYRCFAKVLFVICHVKFITVSRFAFPVAVSSAILADRLLPLPPRCAFRYLPQRWLCTVR